jgi:glycine hydroxymethyltransferase
MELAQGGHLTHGSPVNFSGKLFHFVHYGVRRDTERIDYDQVREVALRERPRMIVAGATAYPRIIDFPAFRAIADEVGAYLLVDMAHIAGLVAAGVHPSPVPHAEVVTLTTHKTLRGPRGGMILSRAEFARKVDSAVFPGMQGGPLDHVIAAKAVALREASTPEYRAYQAQVVRNAQALAAGLGQRGVRLVSGGTDNHLLLVDLTALEITGQEAADRLEAAGIVVNKNMIPFDSRKPVQTSGLRIGTPALTTRGMGEREMEEVAELIISAITRPDDENLGRCRARVRRLCEQFPAPVEALVPA